MIPVMGMRALLRQQLIEPQRRDWEMIPVMQGRALGIGELHRTSTKGLGNDPSHCSPQA